jgi:polyisoprenoid-binding protein YceI
MTDILEIPGYKTGTWAIDPTHSEIAFTIRHLAISKVRGTFTDFTGTITTAENPLETTVDATAHVASVDTNEPNRDGHLRTGDFFDAENHPTLHFVSTGLRAKGEDFLLDGELTMRGVTKPVTFELEFGGFVTDGYGNYKMGFEANTTVKRSEWELTFNAPLEKGGMLLGDDVKIAISAQAALQA